jgi:hypothetical protein
LKSLFSFCLAISVILSLSPLFPLQVKSSVNLKQPMTDNRGCELVTNSVYQLQNWVADNGGYRELQGDINNDSNVDGKDITLIAYAFGASPGSPKWNSGTNPVGPDLNGDGVVDGKDLTIVASEFGVSIGNHCLDEHHSWFTSGGGDYHMWQTLDNTVSLVLAGEYVKFNFYFYPNSTASDGSQNQARAEIYYLCTDGNVYDSLGSWVSPTYPGWWSALVSAQVPYNAYLVRVVIHGTPNFQVWIDNATLAFQRPVAICYSTTPYSNQATDPNNHTIEHWTDGSETASLGNNDTGLVELYSIDLGGTGVGKTAYVDFDQNPVTMDAPWGTPTTGFWIGAYWYCYGYLGQYTVESTSEIGLELDLYYEPLGGGLQKIDSRRFAWYAISNPNQKVSYFGAVYFTYSSPPKGSGYYFVTSHAYVLSTGGPDSGTVADVLTSPYHMRIYLLKWGQN